MESRLRRSSSPIKVPGGDSVRKGGAAAVKKDVLGLWAGENESAKFWGTVLNGLKNRANLSAYFKYPQEVRRLIYTANTIEGFNRQPRKVTKSKSVFPTDDSLFKMLYLAMMDITKK